MAFIVFKQMLIFLIMISIGIIARKRRILTPDNQQQISALVIQIAFPCMILSSAINVEKRIRIEETIDLFVVFIIMLALVLTASAIIPQLLGFPKNQCGAVNMMFWCTNVAYIGLPLIKNLYGDQASIYITLYLMASNFLFYSYGIHCISQGIGEKHKFNLKALLNPGMISCAVACIVYFGSLSVPDVLSQALTMIGNLTSPLAMMMIGFGLLDVNLKESLVDYKMLAFVFLKMLVVPVLIMLFIKQLTDNKYLLAACFAVLATPTGGMVAMMATLYNRETYLLTTKQISLATLLSIVTVPLVAAIIGLGN